NDYPLGQREDKIIFWTYLRYVTEGEAIYQANKNGTEREKILDFKVKIEGGGKNYPNLIGDSIYYYSLQDGNEGMRKVKIFAPNTFTTTSVSRDRVTAF
ncbi:MAG: hypothetical protein LBR56_06955, partial [Sporomusaceae bacterium]|nr:hypothetical protein [Sporomusaceae bacterium]